jgi:hypothetical protein
VASIGPPKARERLPGAPAVNLLGAPTCRHDSLPPNVVQDEKKMQSALDGAKEIVEKLETRICREC